MDVKLVFVGSRWQNERVLQMDTFVIWLDLREQIENKDIRKI